MEVGKSSPRAFYPYDKDKEPDAKYFSEILKNSLNDEEISRFCHDFLGLFKFHQKRHKEKVSICYKVARNSRVFQTAVLFWSFYRSHVW